MTFATEKHVRQVSIEREGRRWTACEIHMGRRERTAPCEPPQRVIEGDATRDEGARRAKVWGTYLHGWFEAPEVRGWIANEAGFASHRAHPIPWAEKRHATYAAMADHVAAHVDLWPIKQFLGA